MNMGQLSGRKPDMRTTPPSDELVSTSLIGVEVEMEGAKRLDTRYWDAKEDGSLRDNGVEYVFSAPLGGNDAVMALRELEGVITPSFKPIMSERTSTHVHVDIRDLNKDELSSFILLYMLFEQPLFHHCGIEREGSNFCTSFNKAQLHVKSVNQFIRASGVDRTQRAMRGTERYAGCNMNATTTFGSLEFRGHRGEWRTEPLLIWINLLLSLKEASRTIKYNAITHQVKQKGTLAFLASVFGNHQRHLRYKGVSNDIRIGMKLVDDAIYSDSFAKAFKKERRSTDDGTVSDTFKEFVKVKYPKQLGKLTGSAVKEKVGLEQLLQTANLNARTEARPVVAPRRDGRWAMPDMTLFNAAEGE